MAINATNNATKKELLPAGNYVARCVSMIHIGTVPVNYNGEAKEQNKVRIGWELPTELKVYKEENGEQPKIMSKEFTLSMNEKATLRKLLASWRGKDFTEDEARKFDVTVLVGKPCLLNLIHKPSATDPTKIYEEIAGITPLPKGMPCPEQITKTLVLDYDNFDQAVFDSLPDFIKDSMKKSAEYRQMTHPAETQVQGKSIDDNEDDLPF